MSLPLSFVVTISVGAQLNSYPMFAAGGILDAHAQDSEHVRGSVRDQLPGVGLTTWRLDSRCAHGTRECKCCFAVSHLSPKPYYRLQVTEL